VPTCLFNAISIKTGKSSSKTVIEFGIEHTFL
jgi:hypothetical protein